MNTCPVSCVSGLRRLAAARAALGARAGKPPRRSEAEAFAPANVALCKYWGKRDEDLLLPLSGSVSISLGELGTRTTVRVAESDRYWLNGAALEADRPEARRLREYLDLFRSDTAPAFEVRSANTIPTAAGLASSASAFAALARALDILFGWDLDVRSLSILARLGSGSAARSVATGFMEWHAGERADGADSYAERWPEEWPELRIAVQVVSNAPKPMGSREAMRHTRETSPLFAAWSQAARRDLETIRQAVGARDFGRLGRAAEANALAMHATMIAARPALCYWLPETLVALRRVEELRTAGGISVFATLDAGPNVKLLFLESDEHAVQEAFPESVVVSPFSACKIPSSHSL